MFCAGLLACALGLSSFDRVAAIILGDGVDDGRVGVRGGVEGFFF